MGSDSWRRGQRIPSGYGVEAHEADGTSLHTGACDIQAVSFTIGARMMCDASAIGLPSGSTPGIVSPLTARLTLAEAFSPPGTIGDCGK